MPAAVLQPAPVRTKSRGTLRTKASSAVTEPPPGENALPAVCFNPAIPGNYMLGSMTSQTPPNDLWQSTSNRLWKTLSSEEKSLAAAELVKDNSPLIRASVTSVVADARKMRPIVARKLPAEVQARIVATVRDPGEILASSLLVALHLGPRRPMLVAFLDALGLPHEDGVLKDEATAPIALADLERARAALRSESPSAVRIYLNTLWLQDPDRWEHAKDMGFGA
jgi:hypothetical protein